MDDDTGWFPGDEPRADDEALFLAAVRARVAADGLEDVTPEMTSVMALGGFVPLLLRVEVPGLPPALANLQVGYTEGDDVGPPRLVGEWGDKYLLDNHGRYPDDLSVEGVHATPEEFADFAVEWLRRQLRRHVDAQEWCRGSSVVGTQWRFVDTGGVLATDGGWFRRLRRLQPRSRRVR